MRLNTTMIHLETNDIYCLALTCVCNLPIPPGGIVISGGWKEIGYPRPLPCPPTESFDTFLQYTLVYIPLLGGGGGDIILITCLRSDEKKGIPDCWYPVRKDLIFCLKGSTDLYSLGYLLNRWWSRPEYSAGYLKKFWKLLLFRPAP